MSPHDALLYQRRGFRQDCPLSRVTFPFAGPSICRWVPLSQTLAASRRGVALTLCAVAVSRAPRRPLIGGCYGNGGTPALPDSALDGAGLPKVRNWFGLNQTEGSFLGGNGCSFLRGRRCGLIWREGRGINKVIGWRRSTCLEGYPVRFFLLLFCVLVVASYFSTLLLPLFTPRNVPKRRMRCEVAAVQFGEFERRGRRQK